MGIFFTHASEYWQSGLPVIPCNGKRPNLNRWSEYCERMPTAEEQSTWLRCYPDHNIGLPLGPESGLCCVDIDTDDPAQIAAIRSVLPDTPYERVGKKGVVLMYRWTGQKNFKLKTDDGLQPVEFLGKGNQVIVAPSIHPETGQPYTASANLWEVASHIPELPSDFCRDTLAQALGLKRRKKVKGSGVVKEGARHNALTSYAAVLRNQGHAAEGLLEMLRERNSTFSPPLPDEEVASIANWGDSIEGRVGFERTPEGKVVSNNQSNIQRALDELGVTLRHDAFAGKDLITGVPGHEGGLDDAAVRRLWFMIQETFRFKPSKDYFWDAVLDLAQRNTFDPVCDELQRAQAGWDGVPRLTGWLVRYAGAADTPYAHAVGSAMVIAAVRRARQPGVKFDTMPVLIGSQGCGKSTLCQILAGGPERFTDHIPFNADAREIIEALAGRWIAEAGELHGLRNASAEKLKSFLSRTVDHGRAAFARTTQAVPRRCIFIGTTNSAAFLTDGTGNRRFWPIEVGNVDLLAFTQDRDQIIGEAATREAAGESLTLPQELWQVAAAEQDECRLENPAHSLLESELNGLTGRIRSSDVWKLLKVPLPQQLAMAKVVSSAMQELGWKADKVRFGGRDPERGYIKGTILERCQVLTVNHAGNVLPIANQLENLS